VVAVGRLTRQKGFDLLLEAFAQCHHRHGQWTLRILGEGEEREALEFQASRLKITDAVELIGVVKDHEAHLRSSQLYVLASRYEGFPNSLLEAMAMGLAVIATDCPTGPADIVAHNENGLLVPPNNVAALASAMDRLMADSEERQRLGVRAGEVVERFSLNKVMTVWDSLLAGIARPSHG
jgi:glycosyltransferase involved in cell wall biosynthesis